MRETLSLHINPNILTNFKKTVRLKALGNGRFHGCIADEIETALNNHIKVIKNELNGGVKI